MGGHRKIKMADLKSLCQALGCSDIHSYIQSGNLVFVHRDPPQTLESSLESALEKQYGFEVKVTVFQGQEWFEIVEHQPFEQSDPKSLYLTFLSEAPENQSFLPEANRDEQWSLKGRVLYGFYSQGYGKTKFHNGYFENKLKCTATTRNWKTTLKLKSLLETIQ